MMPLLANIALLKFMNTLKRVCLMWFILKELNTIKTKIQLPLQKNLNNFSKNRMHNGTLLILMQLIILEVLGQILLSQHMKKLYKLINFLKIQDQNSEILFYMVVFVMLKIQELLLFLLLEKMLIKIMLRSY